MSLFVVEVRPGSPSREKLSRSFRRPRRTPRCAASRRPSSARPSAAARRRAGSSFSTAPRSFPRRRSEGGSMTPFVPDLACTPNVRLAVELAQRQAAGRAGRHAPHDSFRSSFAALYLTFSNSQPAQPRRGRSPGAISSAKPTSSGSQRPATRVHLPRHLGRPPPAPSSSPRARLPASP